MWYKSRLIWIPVCALCFSIGVSGSIFCLIRHAELLSYEGRSRVPYIFGDSSYGHNYAEGMIIATLSLFCGMISFWMYYVSMMTISIGRDILILLSIVLFVVAVTNIYEPYALETSYYRMNRLLPFSMWDWLVAPAKKNSGIVKRIIRVSWFTLSECRSLEEFSNKVQIILFAYIKRSYL